MDYYIHEFEKLQEDFHEVMHDYPLFKEDIDHIYDVDIKEINELLDKNDEYYLKEACNKLEDLISYVKDTSIAIKKEYDTFDKLANIWEKKEITNTDERHLNYLNSQVKKANELIKKHDLDSIREANKIMRRLSIE